MARLKDTLTLSVPHGTKERLDELAIRHDQLWGSGPSPSKLVAAIASGELTIGEKAGYSPEQLSALEAAIDALLHRGKHVEARILTTTLLTSPGLADSKRSLLIDKLRSLSSPWLDTVERLRRDRRPFLLSYKSGRGNDSNFTVRSAHVTFHDGAAYLEIYADETDRSEDLPELVHNRSLRLERIQSIVELPGETGWRDDLASTEVTLKITQEMLKFYLEDFPEVEPEAVDGGKAYVVKRRIRLSWWFIRDMLERGPGFEIVSPPELRAKLRAQLEKMLAAHA